MTKPDDFARLIKTIEPLIRIGDKEGAGMMIEAAKGQVAPSDLGLCRKCISRRDRQLEAVRQAKARLREAADGKAEPHTQSPS